MRHLQLRIAQTRRYAETCYRPILHEKIDTLKRRVSLIRKATVQRRHAFTCRAFSSGVPPQSNDIAHGTPSAKLYVRASTLNGTSHSHHSHTRALASSHDIPYAYFYNTLPCMHYRHAYRYGDRCVMCLHRPCAP